MERARRNAMHQERAAIAGIVAEVSAAVAATASRPDAAPGSSGDGGDDLSYSGSSDDFGDNLYEGSKGFSDEHDSFGDDVHKEGSSHGEESPSRPLGQAHLTPGDRSGLAASGGRTGVGMHLGSSQDMAAGRKQSFGRRGSVGSVSSQPGLPAKGYGRRDSSLDVAGAAFFDDYDYDIGVEAGSKDSGSTRAQEQAAMATIRSIQEKQPPPPPPRRGSAGSASPQAPPRRLEEQGAAIPLPASAASDDDQFASDSATDIGKPGAEVLVAGRGSH